MMQKVTPNSTSLVQRIRRWLTKLICPEQLSILRERRAYKQKVMILEEMINTKDERLSQLASDNERLERELSTALEARDRAKAQWRSAREDCNALYQHIHQTRRSKRRQARAQ